MLAIRPKPMLAMAVLALLALTGVDHARARGDTGHAPGPSVSSDTAATLRGRITPPSDETIAAYRQAGAVNAQAHPLTEREWALVERAIADLPPLHRQILERRLGRLSFIDAPSSTGTALTHAYDGPHGRSLFEITLRADVLDRTLSEFLTRKEAALFTEDGSGYSVHVLAGATPALSYLLLHEATHVVDQDLGLSTEILPFGALWTGYRDLSETYAAGPMGRSVYRRGPPMPMSQAPALYRALAASPFVSLYATASASEDLAELSAWSTLSARLGVPLTIEVRDAAGRPVVTVEPLASPAVQDRFATLETLLRRVGPGAWKIGQRRE
jgi:hypothetical protein